MNQNDTNNPILQEALQSLQRGWSVFPVSQGAKRPLVKWKPYQDELPGERKIRNWFGADYRDANLGLVTGELSGRVVLDVDELAGLEEIERRGGLPHTQTVQTRPDIAHKLHFHFQHPDFEVGNFAKKVKAGDEYVELPGLDFRGDGGYVLLPPSVHHSGAGNYEWLHGPDDAPLAPMPDWLLELLRGQSEGRDPTAPAPLPVADVNGDRARKWALGALQKEQDKMLTAPNGQKHQQRFNSARALGGLIHSGALSEAEIYDGLAVNFGPDRKNAEETIRDGIKSGIAAPRELPASVTRNSRPTSIAPPDSPKAPPDRPTKRPTSPEFDTRSLDERGISALTMQTFHLNRGKRSSVRFDGYDCYEFPTYSLSNRTRRCRQWVLDPNQTGGRRTLDCPADGATFPHGYNLPNIASAVREGNPECWLVDSELAVWFFHQAGVPAVCPFSLGLSLKPLMADLARLGVQRLQIALPADEKGAKATLAALSEAAKCNIAAIARALPGPSGFTIAEMRDRCKDDADFARVLNTLSAASHEKLVALAPEPTPESAPEAAPGKPEKLLDIIEKLPGMNLFHTEDNETYISLPRDTHQETHRVTGSDFGSYIRHVYQRETKHVVDGGTVDNVLAVLDGRARFDSPLDQIHTRSAEHNGRIYIDLCDEEWNCVEIGPDVPGDWRIIQNPPVKFRRAKGMEPLPKPVKGGNWNELKKLINAEDEANWILTVSWLVMALRPPDYPYPMLSVHGEQETGKSTLCRIVRRIVDPNFTSLINTAEIDRRDLAIICKNSFVVGFDNLSRMSSDINDALCSLVTEGCFRTRKLRTDDEEMLFKARRPIVLNGINENMGQNDLRRRSLKIHLEPMKDSKLDEEEIWRAFAVAWPRLLGLICDAICCALAQLPSVELPHKVGLLDFARWIIAAEPVLPWEQGRFAQVYLLNLQQSIEAANDADAFTISIIDFVENRGFLKGTPTDCRQELERFVDNDTRREPGWPKTIKAWSQLLNRIAPNLRAVGIEVSRDRLGTHRELDIRRIATVPEARPVSGA